MACSTYTLNGIARGCKDSIGGIKKVWLAADYDKVLAMIDRKAMNEGTTAANAVFTLKSTATVDPLAAEFKVFNFFANTGSLTSTLQTAENAGNSWQTELSLQFMKMETSKRLEIEAMLMGECCAFVEDVNGKVWFLGLDRALTGTAGVAQTGTSNTDLNGYTVTITDASLRLPFEVTKDDIIEALEAITIA